MTNQRSTLFIINADGTNLQQIGAAPAGQMFDYPWRSPEGRMILFARHAFPNNTESNVALETIDVKGGKLRTLSTTLAPDTWPLIRPPQ